MLNMLNFGGVTPLRRGEKKTSETHIFLAMYRGHNSIYNLQRRILHHKMMIKPSTNNELSHPPKKMYVHDVLGDMFLYFCVFFVEMSYDRV